MARMLSTAFCVALLAATAVAFALIRAPRKPALYTLYVTAAGRTASSSVVVTRRDAP